jgi:hypothetical protein
MQQAGIALVLVSSPNALGLPVTQPHQLGRLHLAQLFGFHARHDSDPIPFLPIHRQCLHVKDRMAHAIR